ncbi:BCS1 N terminal-domain-containing protein [Mycena rosella]|uniref:BCS1 N terminal-domain-containing protein n=1 Tax=Mycena rosella TaxID=1033263 RepID=A0AAD7H1D1_MYCRO|nr:BCS1 N terminal-domain-containing protein [Mycena rosella]
MSFALLFEGFKALTFKLDSAQRSPLTQYPKGVGAAMTLARTGSIWGATVLRRRMLVSLEIDNRDRAYDWFLGWMAHRTSSAAASASRSAPWIRSHELSVETMIERRPNGSSSVFFQLVAGPGTHWFKYKGAWMQVKRERETRSMMGGQQTGMAVPWETVTLTTLSRDRKLFPELLAEARDLGMRGQEGNLVIHTAWGIEWRPFGKPRRKRPLQSVVLEPGMGEKIEEDIKAFLARRQWYADRGIPYRRGYLLHGPPGSGKTSFIQALAGSLSYDICLLNLSERGLADDKLNHLLSNAPERSFVLIEDVDAAFNKRVQTSADGYQSSVTFSGFLNALDGVASGEERIVFMTTNHVDQLDPALIRPGRVDFSALVDNASPLQARTLFHRFYSGGTYDDIGVSELDVLAQNLQEIVEERMKSGERVSMAALQGHFIRNQPKEAVARSLDLFGA